MTYKIYIDTEYCYVSFIEETAEFNEEHRMKYLRLEPDYDSFRICPYELTGEARLKHFVPIEDATKKQIDSVFTSRYRETEKPKKLKDARKFLIDTATKTLEEDDARIQKEDEQRKARKEAKLKKDRNYIRDALPQVPSHTIALLFNGLIDKLPEEEIEYIVESLHYSIDGPMMRQYFCSGPFGGPFGG